MDARAPNQRAPPKSSAGMDESEEMVGEVDEEPDELKPTSPFCWYHGGFNKAKSPSFSRRESLLTRQFHSETEHHPEHDLMPPRALSTQSTCSTQSVTSMADLTSDDGRSVPSPHISPPLSPTSMSSTLIATEKPLGQEVKIVGHDEPLPITKATTATEQSVEAGLGRKRCITFACKGKQEVEASPAPAVEHAPPPAFPPKRKCMIKFACPSKVASSSKAIEPVLSTRPASPAPAKRTSSSSSSTNHGGSDSAKSDKTVTHASPDNITKSATIITTVATPIVVSANLPSQTRRASLDSNADSSGNEATRFHEFGTSDEEPEEWVKESTCYKSRLTVNDTLKKEIVIRATCEQAEEEALEDEDEDDDDDVEEDEAELDDEDEDQPQAEMPDDDHESDEGFHSDDEHGFANSDSEGDDSDYEWWKPAPTSTAATSVEHLDRLAIVNYRSRGPSSVGSASSGEMSPRESRHVLRKPRARHGQTPAMTINKRDEGDLPDSTDFVCGTLDEDRPLEQAFINRLKMKQAAKRGIRPQDIDPTFPTSDPEMDEEDDDDVDEVDASDETDHGDLMHGNLEEIDGEGTLKRSPSLRSRQKRTVHRSPPPPARLHSPAPAKRRSIARSPPPPQRRGTARSPPPSKLFSRSPKRMRSPAPLNRMTSPPNSPTGRPTALSFAPRGLAGRPQPTHTSSLPRGGGLTLSKLATVHSDDEDFDNNAPTEVPKRGAIDIVKGLEKKRRIRKEKLYQKMCAKNAARGEKVHKVKPGKGAERMREVGLQLQQYQGKAEHILSL